MTAPAGSAWLRAPRMARGGRGASGAVGGRTPADSTGGVVRDIPHRNAACGEYSVATEAPVAEPETLGRGVPRVGVWRGPLVFTRIADPSNATSTVPSVSVRYVVSAIARSRSIVDGAGWPYGFPAPAETIAKRGRTASRNASVVAVLDPW